jgi:hypothetical protein
VKAALLALLCLLIMPADAAAQAAPSPPEGVSVLLGRLEQVLTTNNASGLAALTVAGPGPAPGEAIADWVQPGVTRAAIQPRLIVKSADVPDDQGYDVYVDVLAESGRSGRVGTWFLQVQRDPASTDAWRIASLAVLTSVRGLYRLALNPEKQFAVTAFAFDAEDVEIRLPQGMAFIAETDFGVTAMVLLGRGSLKFAPAPASEKGQVKIYSGAESLQRSFTWLYLRVNQEDLDRHTSVARLQQRTVDPQALRRADTVFQQNVRRTFGLNLADLSRDTWSVIPKRGDAVVEMQTPGAHLAYMRSVDDSEDVRFIDRTRERTIALYASKEKLASRGEFFDEDDRVDYDIVHYDIDASFDPRREWIEGKVKLFLTARNAPVSTLILTLAEPLAIRSVVSRRLGYVMALRVSGQNDVIVNLPKPLPPDALLDLEFHYAGALPAVPPEREALELAQPVDFFTLPSQPSYIYTGRSAWYPQGGVTDYATASLTLRVPDGYSTVASGALEEGSPRLLPMDRGVAWREYRFHATQPARYLGWGTSRFVQIEKSSLSIAPDADGKTRMGAGVFYNTLDLSVLASGVLQRRARQLSVDARRILEFYGQLVGDLPYQSFTLAVVERNVPGGHSPPYFAALSQPPPATPIAWRNDPAYFDDFPEFFVAHEIAHQWWGQAVGWKNYHEQWLSEGFAQYFAALYAEKLNRDGVFPSIIRQMGRSTMQQSDQGPVYLGYRLGHIRNNSRIFRALVYNKGALTLHMLRRLVGDEVFFRGIRRFYTTWRFRKAGTDDLKAAFEAEAGRSLDRFFDRWIHDSALPHLRFSYKTEPNAVTVRFEQVGEPFDVPVTVTLQYGTSSVDVIVPITDDVTTQRIPLTGRLRNVSVNRDGAAPIIIVR